jgi:hypothetical protein
MRGIGCLIGIVIAIGTGILWLFESREARRQYRVSGPRIILTSITTLEHSTSVLISQIQTGQATSNEVRFHIDKLVKFHGSLVAFSDRYFFRSDQQLTQFIEQAAALLRDVCAAIGIEGEAEVSRLYLSIWTPYKEALGEERFKDEVASFLLKQHLRHGTPQKFER